MQGMESFKYIFELLNSLSRSQTIKLSYLYLIVTTFIIVTFYVINIDKFIRLTENTNIERFFNEHNKIIIEACVSSILISIALGIDLLLDFHFSWKAEINDTNIRFVTFLTLLVPATITLGFINCECLPSLFCLLHIIQVLIITNATYTSCSLTYSKSFNAVYFHGINFTLSLAAITMILSYGDNWYTWVHLLSYVLVGFSLYYQCRKCISLLINTEIWRKRLVDLKAKQVYCISYLSSFIVIVLSLIVLTLFSWVEMNFIECVVVLYCLPFYSMLIILIPGRLARTASLNNEEILHFKRKMIRYLSHEIRSPLNVVNSTLALSIIDLRRTSAPGCNENILDSFEDMKHACSSAICILDDMLNIESMDNGTFKLDKEVLEYSSTITEIVDNNRIYALQKGIELVIKDERSSDFMNKQDNNSKYLEDYIYIDKFKIEQLVRNLIVNAVKFTNTGGNITVSIKSAMNVSSSSNNNKSSFHNYHTASLIDLESSNNSSKFSHTNNLAVVQSYAEESPLPPSKKSLASAARSNGCELNLTRNALIEIKDTGIGIDPSDLHKLFQEFAQLNARELQGGSGSGLGLWICKQITREHNGQISCTSEGKGLGCTFSVTLPIYYKPSGDSSTNGAHKIIGKTYGSMGIKKISTDQLKLYENMPLLNETKHVELVVPMIPSTIKHRVLVVDDSVINRKVITKILHHIADNSKNNYLASRILAAEEGNHNATSSSSSSSSSNNNNSSSIIEESSFSGQLPVSFEITEADDGITALAEITSNLQTQHINNDHSSINDDGTFIIPSNIIHNDSNTTTTTSMITTSSSSNSPYFAILIDNIMVHMHGPESTKRIRALGYKGIIIAITGNVMTDDVADFLKNGADYVMKKPISINELEQILTAAFYSRNN